jgi:Tol biopolymer transport system component
VPTQDGVIIAGWDGSNPTVVQPDIWGEARWSPTGDYVALVEGAAQQDKGIVIVGPDGATRTIYRGDARFTHWSPDGNRLAFSARTPSGAVEAFVISVDGSTLRQVTHLSGIYFVAW